MRAAARGDHVARGGAGAQEDAGQVDVDDLLPVGQRELGRRPADRDARRSRRARRGARGARRPRAIAASIAASSVTSSAIASAPAGSWPASRGRARRPCAPRAASSSAQAAPMPFAPPATTATSPRRSVRREGSAMRRRPGAASALGGVLRQRRRGACPARRRLGPSPPASPSTGAGGLREHAQRLERAGARRPPSPARAATPSPSFGCTAVTSAPPSSRTRTSRKLPRKTRCSTRPGSRFSPARALRLDAHALGPDHRLDVAARVDRRPARRAARRRRP